MESIAVLIHVTLVLFSVSYVCCAVGDKDSTLGLILREMFKQQSELDKQRWEIGRLRADAETQKSAVEKQQSEISRLVAELDKQKSENEKAKSEAQRHRAEFDKQQSTVQKWLDIQASTKGPSASYIRWGRTRCDGSSSIVYKGYASGPLHHTEGGSGSNFLCLHENPQWKRYLPVTTSTGGIYGVQYETWEGNNNVFSLSNNGEQSLGAHPAPCVMCNVPNRSTVIMIPARNECPAGWNKEYGGYVISSYRTYIKTSYICWDEAPETSPGASNGNQAMICHTKVHCGTLPCSSYINGRELTCVVCSK